MCLVWGNNIFFGPAFAEKVRAAAEGLEEGAVIFGYYVEDPRPFGVVEFDASGKAISIEEKPAVPKSNYIVPGLYFYDNEVVRTAAEVEPSARGELEITSLNNAYLEKGELQVVALGEEYSWFDAGTADSLYVAAGEIREAQKVSEKMIGCLEEIALENGWITAAKSAYRARKKLLTEWWQIHLTTRNLGGAGEGCCGEDGEDEVWGVFDGGC